MFGFGSFSSAPFAALPNAATFPAPPPNGWQQNPPSIKYDTAARIAAVATALFLVPSFVSYQPSPPSVGIGMGWYVQNPLPAVPAKTARLAYLTGQDFGPFVAYGWQAANQVLPAQRPALRLERLTHQTWPFLPYGWPTAARVLPAQQPAARSAALVPQDFGPFVPFGWMAAAQVLPAQPPRAQQADRAPQEWPFQPFGWMAANQILPAQKASPNWQSFVSFQASTAPLTQFGWLVAQNVVKPLGLKPPAQDYAWLQAQTVTAALNNFGWYSQPSFAYQRTSAGFLNTATSPWLISLPQELQYGAISGNAHVSGRLSGNVHASGGSTGNAHTSGGLKGNLKISGTTTGNPRTKTT